MFKAVIVTIDNMKEFVDSLSIGDQRFLIVIHLVRKSPLILGVITMRISLFDVCRSLGCVSFSCSMKLNTLSLSVVISDGKMCINYSIAILYRTRVIHPPNLSPNSLGVS